MDFPLHTHLADLLPHKPPMILLDSIHRFDAQTIQCGSQSHLNPHNPLRQKDRLSVFAGVEYAAQAMALHARLTAAAEKDFARPRRGFLAVANKLHAYVRDLDECRTPLLIEVTRINGDKNSSQYVFVITAETENRTLLEGQLIAVMAEPETDPA